MITAVVVLEMCCKPMQGPWIFLVNMLNTSSIMLSETEKYAFGQIILHRIPTFDS